MNKKRHTVEVSKKDIVLALLVFLCVIVIKFWYQNASIDSLRWLIGPSVQLVEWSTGIQFTYISEFGYLSADSAILIDKSCSGMNFLIIITTFSVYLRITQAGSLLASKRGWFLIPILSFLISILANTTRIQLSVLSVSLEDIFRHWISHSSVHRAEGIFVYLLFIGSYYFLCSLSLQRHTKQRSNIYIRRTS